MGEGRRLRLKSLLFPQTGIVFEEIRIVLCDEFVKPLHFNRERRAIKGVFFVRIKFQIKGPAPILLQRILDFDEMIVNEEIDSSYP